MDSIPNFTPAEIETVRQLIHQRCQETIGIQLADSELKLDLKREQQVDCPTVFWYMWGANFAVIRSGVNRYRCQFSIPHTTSTALAGKNMIRSNSASPPYWKYKHITNETMVYRDSKSNLAVNHFLNPASETHHSPGDL